MSEKVPIGTHHQRYMDERPQHDEKNLLHMRLHKLQDLIGKEKQEE